MTLMHFLFNALTYGCLVLVTTGAGFWKTRWTLRACSVLLFASWAVSRLLIGRAGLSDLVEAYGFSHGCIFLVTAVLLVFRGSLWLAFLTAVSTCQFVVHGLVLLDVQTSDAQLVSGYQQMIAVLFTAQLVCIWFARTRAGAWWPEAWREVDLRVEEAA